MSDQFPQRIAFTEALAIIDRIALNSRLSEERIVLSLALGRVLAEDLQAPINLPGFDNSAMDGFAVRSQDLTMDGLTNLQLVGEQFAGRNQSLTIGAGQCVRITTGAPLPAGADAIVIKEIALLDGNTVRVPGVHQNAHVRRAGEDVQIGDKVLETGDTLTPARLSLAAALGQHDLSVARRPTVAVFTSGDELKSPGLALAAGEIYDSNRVLLQTLLSADGYQPVAWPALPDDPERMQAALRDAAFSFDVVITCGGVSVGEKDFLPELLREHGEIYFWKVQMRPGMPVLFGRLGDALLLCLPGNPVSVFATYLTLARRLLDGLQGRSEVRPRVFARLLTRIEKSHPRLEFRRGDLHCDEHGQCWVMQNPADGSHRLRAVAQSNALIVLPEGPGDWPEGSVLEVLPLAAF